jgi:hypothetical protein
MEHYVAIMVDGRNCPVSSAFVLERCRSFPSRRAPHLQLRRGRCTRMKGTSSGYLGNGSSFHLTENGSVSHTISGPTRLRPLLRGEASPGVGLCIATAHSRVQAYVLRRQLFKYDSLKVIGRCLFLGVTIRLLRGRLMQATPTPRRNAVPGAGGEPWSSTPPRGRWSAIYAGS